MQIYVTALQAYDAEGGVSFAPWKPCGLCCMSLFLDITDSVIQNCVSCKNTPIDIAFTIWIIFPIFDATLWTLPGDKNPLHCDTDYAVASGFPSRVVYGMLIASFYSTLAGMYLPGLNSLLMSVDTKFHKPAFVGDVLHITGAVHEKFESMHMMVVKAVIRNQRKEKVSSARIQIIVRDANDQQS